MADRNRDRVKGALAEIVTAPFGFKSKLGRLAMPSITFVGQSTCGRKRQRAEA
jgi:hypothetical protein